LVLDPAPAWTLAAAEEASLTLQGGRHQLRLPDHSEMAIQGLAQWLEAQAAGSGQSSAQEDCLRREHDGGPGEHQRQRLRCIDPYPPCGRVAVAHVAVPDLTRVAAAGDERPRVRRRSVALPS
jgi:hypothetical protein